MRKEREQAIRLRKQGLSYNVISKRFGVPKSTMSTWFKNLVLSSEVKAQNIRRASSVWARNITLYNKRRSQLARQRWVSISSAAQGEIGRLTPRELLLVGAALYWAEGYKKTNWNLAFCNSDPAMVAVMMKFFRFICKIPTDKMRAQMQLYPNISDTAAIKFWARVTGIPKKQFHSSIRLISKSSKLRRGSTLPHGTIRIRINDVTLINKIKGWIAGIAES